MKEIDANTLQKLRERGLLTEKEVAFLSGDLIIAENVITKDRRVVEGASKIIAESNRRILKG
jgi:hypothetical protein